MLSNNSNDVSDSIRDDLKLLKPYESFDFEIPVRLNTNENPYSVPSKVIESVLEKLTASLKNLNRYPDNYSKTLTDALVNYLNKTENLKITSQNVLGGNGSNEIMQQIFSAFGGPNRSVLNFNPTYSMYPQYARDSFTNCFNLNRNLDDFTIDFEEAKSFIKKNLPNIVILTNPNNPTGTWTDFGHILDFAKFLKDVSPQTVLVIDEAYIHFRNDSEVSAISLVESFNNVIIVRTLSKALSLAGVRFGFAIANASLINALKIVRLPYNLSSINQTIVKVALEEYSELEKNVNELKLIRKNLVHKLENDLNSKLDEFSKIKVFSSSANFVLIRFNNSANNFEKLPELFYEYAKSQGVLIRVVGGAGCFRVTIGTSDETNRFIDVFDNFLSNML